MTDPSPAPLPTSTNAGTPRRKAPPLWGIILFLVLLGGLAIVNQMASTGGEPIVWIEDDLPAALEQARTGLGRVFLYLYEPDDPIHARNERELFSKRWAREPLALVPCCRIALKKDDLRKVKYGYKGTPLFLLLDEAGEPLRDLRAEGPIDERQFRTYIAEHIRRAQQRKNGEAD